MMNSSTPKPSIKFCALPKFVLPPRSLNATGISVKPIIVTTEPVTTGGNRRINLPNRPEKIRTNSPEAMIAP
ncbi:hypothetical protein D3C75_1357140 [compost metagenome]